jgi:glucosamine--fructose-6-phosphate aminotransferase (isomerizing)
MSKQTVPAGSVISHLESEIRAQPRILRARADAARAATDAAGRLLTAPSVEHVLLLGRGSSGNAAAFGQYLLGDALGLPAYRVDPGLWQGPHPLAVRDAAVVAISQSGHADDLEHAVRTARGRGCPTIAVTNDPDSPLAAEADVTVPLLAGPELSVPATKTYTATLHALAALAAASGAEAIAQELDRLPDLVGRCVERSFETVPQVVTCLGVSGERPGLLTVVGQRTGQASAAEIALKIREVAGWPAEALSVPDLLHGPVAALSADSVVWLVETGTPAYWATVRDRLRRTGARIVSVAPGPAEAGTMPLPDGLPTWLLDLVAVVPGQVAALLLGRAAGRDVDRPHGLTKVTTAP